MIPSIGKDGIKGAPPAPSEPVAEEFESFHARLFKKAQDAIKDYDRRKLSKDLLTRDALDKAHRAIRRGAQTRAFLEGEFWTEHLKSALGEEQDVKPWEPGDPRSLEEVAVTHLFSSGKSSLVKVILKKFDEWIRLGDSAKKVVEAHVSLQEKIREIPG
jgi:hypothetical protein